MVKWKWEIFTVYYCRTSEFRRMNGPLHGPRRVCNQSVDGHVHLWCTAGVHIRRSQRCWSSDVGHVSPDDYRQTPTLSQLSSSTHSIWKMLISCFCPNEGNSDVIFSDLIPVGAAALHRWNYGWKHVHLLMLLNVKGDGFPPRPVCDVDQSPGLVSVRRWNTRFIVRLLSFPGKWSQLRPGHVLALWVSGGGKSVGDGSISVQFVWMCGNWEGWETWRSVECQFELDCFICQN